MTNFTVVVDNNSVLNDLANELNTMCPSVSDITKQELDGIWSGNITSILARINGDNTLQCAENGVNVLEQAEALWGVFCANMLFNGQVQNLCNNLNSSATYLEHHNDSVDDLIKECNLIKCEYDEFISFYSDYFGPDGNCNAFKTVVKDNFAVLNTVSKRYIEVTSSFYDVIDALSSQGENTSEGEMVDLGADQEFQDVVVAQKVKPVANIYALSNSRDISHPLLIKFDALNDVLQEMYNNPFTDKKEKYFVISESAESVFSVNGNVITDISHGKKYSIVEDAHLIDCDSHEKCHFTMDYSTHECKIVGEV